MYLNSKSGLQFLRRGAAVGAGAYWIGADVELAEGAVEAAPMPAAQVPWDTGRSPILHNET